ncbi:hypothetical protein [Propionivibrio limicola]|uniref:hypothetical protein n=1 Tax=Propionivibrio limicola TaxID=167645 RepID=UPI0012924A72|nr:hypothetical protein [Propionivibrio limicola]
MNLTEYLRQLQTQLGDTAWSQKSTEESPLRSELFSADQMEQHGKALAASHTLSSAHAPDHLLARLAENESALVRVCSLLTAAVSANRRITPAGGLTKV